MLRGSGPVTISHSLFRRNSNSGYYGGAIYNAGSPLHISNSTFYNNYGGAIGLLGGATEIIHSTFAEDFGTLAADIYHNTSDPLLLANSILGDTQAGENCKTTTPGALTVVNSLIETGNESWQASIPVISARASKLIRDNPVIAPRNCSSFGTSA